MINKDTFYDDISLEDLFTDNPSLHVNDGLDGTWYTGEDYMNTHLYTNYNGDNFYILFTHIYFYCLSSGLHSSQNLFTFLATITVITSCFVFILLPHEEVVGFTGTSNTSFVTTLFINACFFFFFGSPCI